MEHVPGGDLENLVESNGALLEDDVKAMARQVLDALDYIHQHLIVHRDIKPSSILIQSRRPFIVKLAGFTLSAVRDDNETFLRTFTGTLLYCAPEVYSEFGAYDSAGRRHLRNRQYRAGQAIIGRLSPRYDHAVDVWSLGGTLFYALTRSPPFPVTPGTSYSELLDRIMTSPLDTSPLMRKKNSKDCVLFLSQMLQRRPEFRATVISLQTHPWLGSSRLTDQSGRPVFPGEISDTEHQLGPSPSRDEPGYSVIAQASELEAPNSDSGYGTASNWTHRAYSANKSTTPGQRESESQAMDPESDDNATVYSDTSSLSDQRIESYSSKLVEDLVAGLELNTFSEKVLDSMARSLPGLLKALASKLGHQAPSQMHRDVMVFLLKNRE